MIGRWLARRREITGERYDRAMSYGTRDAALRARARYAIADLILDLWTAQGTRDHPLSRPEG